MALIKCPKCGADISEYAKTCPHCGVDINVTQSTTRKKASRKKGLVLYICAVVVFAILGILFMFYKETSTGVVEDNKVVEDTDTSVISQDFAPIDVLSFCFFDAEVKVMDIKKVSQLIRSLEELKFQKTSETESETDFATDDSYTDFRKIKNYTYERGDGQNYIKVKIEGIDDEYDIVRNGNIEIVFSDKKLANTFLSDAENNHFTKVSSNSYQGPKYDEIYWTGTDLEVDGNTIVLKKRYHGD